MLDERLEEQFHRLLLRHLTDEVVLEQRVGLETIDGGGAVAVELQQEVAAHELVDTRVVVEGPGLIGLVSLTGQ